MDFYRSLSQLKLFDVWNFVCLLCLFRTCLSACPTDVQTYANGCVVEYNAQLKHIEEHDRQFFSGVDVENLRSLCSKYESAIFCIQGLHKECPPQMSSQIDVDKIVSFDGSQTELSELCKDDKILEVYARNQNCFIIHGQYSEECFKRAMGINISAIKDVSKKPLNQFCSALKSLNSCISTNILLKCGKEAESLVDILLKASIKRSAECAYTVPLSQPSSSGTSNKNKNGHNGSNSGNSLWRNYTLYITVLLCLIFLVLKHSIRL